MQRCTTRLIALKILRPTQHTIGHFGDVLPNHSLGLVLENQHVTIKRG